MGDGTKGFYPKLLHKDVCYEGAVKIPGKCRILDKDSGPGYIELKQTLTYMLETRTLSSTEMKRNFNGHKETL